MVIKQRDEASEIHENDYECCYSYCILPWLSLSTDTFYGVVIEWQLWRSNEALETTARVANARWYACTTRVPGCNFFAIS